MKSLSSLIHVALFGLVVSAPPASAQSDDAFDLHYETCGAGTDTIVFVHGGMLHSAAFDEVWAEVCKSEDFAAVRYDRRGYGRSPVATESYSNSEDLAALVQHLGLTKAILVANSSGANIALDYALSEQSILEGLLLSAPAIGPYRYSDEYIRRNMAILSPLQDNNVSEAIRRVSADSYYVSPENSLAHSRMVEILTDNPQNFGPHRFRSPPPFVFDRLVDVMTPVLLLVGEQDHPDNIEHASILRSILSFTLLKTVPQAANQIQLEQPQVFAAHVLDLATRRLR
ncbi:MAG: alpha/beta hydrolase [Rhodospirillaceae bacterium]|jgi:pimeloyl-ACP methyl ester carboxylesterase|nr:alpha/beta hydrolase [Rhodospirillaceae bacterium]MBT5241866.1 alpha/beta hydrolase [Rhodospirillaceae bacterium]MBT5565281.1 alpha/beta hydrolase [Rhodospirillaceae bacterium]MBT6089980.1 alpha/beta hydrolase [Rhodospirillaceae bacterium]